MSHKLLPFDIKDEPVKTGFVKALGRITGRFGLGLYIGGKELFFGLSINDVITEELVKRRKLLSVPKGQVKVFKFD
jgi:hypothetical protein